MTRTGTETGREDDGRGVLLISYHFPPSAAVGGRRMANFATRLRLVGWDAHVLTIPESRVEEIDRGRLRDVEGVPVHTAPVWPTAIGIISSAARLRRGAAERGDAGPTPGPSGAAGRVASEPLSRRLRRYVLSFALLPDGQKGWCVPAVTRAVQTIRRHRLQWFMTSCPPYSVHLIGLAVRALTRARWVADFRDPWMTTGWKRLYPTCALSILIESWLERRVVEHADLIVFNVDRLRKAYCDRYSHLSPEKFVYIPNGLGSSGDIAFPSSKSGSGRFTITYTGSLYVGRSPEPLFRAVSQLISSGTMAPDDICIKLVGHCRYIAGDRTEAIVRKYGLESVVDVLDPVPYAEAFELVRRSHVALLLAPNLPYQIPAKVYDYLGAGTRILAIAEEGGTADLLKETGAGVAFAEGDVDGIAGFIRHEWATGSKSTQRPLALERFDVRQLTVELVGHLKRVAAAKPSGYSA